MLSIQLSLRQVVTEDLTYQHLLFECESDLPIACLKDLPLPQLAPEYGLVIEGKGPNWLYSYLAARSCFERVVF
jgi:hypothetical protein